MPVAVRSIGIAIMPVHPVWWLPPMPAPLPSYTNRRTANNLYQLCSGTPFVAPVSGGRRLVVRDQAPGIPAAAVVLAKCTPLTFARVATSFFPAYLRRGGFLQPASFPIASHWLTSSGGRNRLPFRRELCAH
jgi:hypothetical protein